MATTPVAFRKVLLSPFLCLLGCGGEEVPPPAPQVGRVDVSIDHSACASCEITQYAYALTPPGSFNCAYQQGSVEPDDDELIKSFKPPASGKVGLAVMAMCGYGERCIRCFALLDISLADRLTQTVRLSSLPVCVKALPGLPGYPLPRCP